MKNLRLLFTLLFVTAFASYSFGQGITGTAHDFSGAGYGSTQICIFCHTPHNADVTELNAPLWNHEITAAVFTPYSTATLDATVGQPSGSSKLCLSCHDGTVAIDSYGSSTGTDFLVDGTDPGYVGIDISDDHPISFTYDATLATDDGGLYDPSSATTTLGGTIDADLLIGGQMECASCHDVHDDLGTTNLLRIGNASSALCLTCHDK